MPRRFELISSTILTHSFSLLTCTSTVTNVIDNLLLWWMMFYFLLVVKFHHHGLQFLVSSNNDTARNVQSWHEHFPRTLAAMLV